jgi:hypothetical protein
LRVAVGEISPSRIFTTTSIPSTTRPNAAKPTSPPGFASNWLRSPTMIVKSPCAVPGALRAIESAPLVWLSPVTVVGSCGIGG